MGTTTAPEARPGTRVREAYAVWPVKASFCRYVAGLPDGMCATSRDVRLIDGRRYVLPGRVRGTGHDLVWDSPASLVFTGHGGLLQIALREPRLELAAGAGALLVARDGGRRLRLASATLAARFGAALQVDLRLTPEGAALFGGTYEADEPLDPLHLIVEQSAR